MLSNIKQKTSVVMASVLAVSLLGGAAFNSAQAQSGYNDDFRGKGKMSRQFKCGDKIHRAIDQLDLSEDQKASIAALRESHQASRQSHRESMKNLRQQKRELKRSSPVDEAAIRSLNQQIAELKSEQEIHRAKAREEVKALLTEEQKAQLEEIRKNRQEARQGKRKGKGRGQGRY